MKKIKPITVDEFIEANFQTTTKIPPNAFCVYDVMKKTGYTKSTAQIKVNELMEAGAIERIKILRDGHSYTYYIPKK